ncbi:hypothetical protein AAF712_011850 [Marasmius tenuissimus]|uniref:Uncharacterized protein n=1 Tax=Marasmius tenuissimus TaxID=585030 RepID=A0ABR2ZJ33_9AGAR
MPVAVGPVVTVVDKVDPVPIAEDDWAKEGEPTTPVNPEADSLRFVDYGLILRLDGGKAVDAGCNVHRYGWGTETLIRCTPLE